VPLPPVVTATAPPVPQIPTLPYPFSELARFPVSTIPDLYLSSHIANRPTTTTTTTTASNNKTNVRPTTNTNAKTKRKRKALETSSNDVINRNNSANNDSNRSDGAENNVPNDKSEILKKLVRDLQVKHHVHPQQVMPLLESARKYFEGLPSKEPSSLPHSNKRARI